MQMLLTDTTVNERRLDAAGVSTKVLEAGAGPSVVLLHGQGGFAEMWMPILAGLAPTYHVVAPDLPGLGASEAPAGSFSPGAVVAWLARLIDKTCDSPPALVGTSLGGTIAARFAAVHSDRLTNLVLVDAGGLSGPVRPALPVLLALIRHSLRPSRRTALGMLRRVAVDETAVRRQMGHRFEPFIDYLVDRSRIPSVQRANRQLLRQIGFPRIPPEQLSRISVPTTLIWGRHDKVMPLRTAQIASARYGWPLHVIEDAGHFLSAEQPAVFLKVLTESLAPARRG